MSVSKAAKQGKSGINETKVRQQKVAAAPKSKSKKEGTRAGVLVDWRAAGKGTTKSDAGRRNRLRDGS